MEVSNAISFVVLACTLKIILWKWNVRHFLCIGNYVRMEVTEEEEEQEETVYFDQSVDEVDNFIVVSTLVSQCMFIIYCTNAIFIA